MVCTLLSLNFLSYYFIALLIHCLTISDTGYARQGSSTTCTSTSTTSTTTTTTTTTSGSYARFASYDCDNSPYNTFYGQSPDWVQVPGGKITNGAEVYYRDVPDGSEGYWLVIVLLIFYSWIFTDFDN